MSLTIPVAHDFICPWCWVALFQVKRLEEEFGVKFDWVGYELFPEELEWPDWPAPVPPPANKPPVPSRLDFILIADDVKIPKVERPPKMRTYFAHQAVEYAKTEGVASEMVEKLYRGLWEDGQNINDVDVLLKLGQGIIKDANAYEMAIRERTFRDKIVGFDNEAYSKGVYNVPTYFIGEERYAEQPYAVLRDVVSIAVTG
jgi:predicted DsbA family dithiol-disulfide isomerase